MAVEITRARYVSVAGVPLMTPAWHVLDMSEVYDGPSSRGSDVLVPYSPGMLPTARFIGPARKVLPMVIFGTHDEDGSEHSDPRMGLIHNLNTLKRALRTRQRSATTTFRVEFEAEGLGSPWVLSAPCSVNWPLQTAARPSTIRLLLDLTLPGGVLRDEEPIGQALQTAGPHTVLNPGTAEQFAVQITMPTATTLENTTWGHTLTYTGTDPVTINTANGTAVYGNGTTALGLVSWSGHSNMFPLAVGDNTVQLTSANPNVGVTHYPAYA
jgi:hypothetical protein